MILGRGRETDRGRGGGGGGGEEGNMYKYVVLSFFGEGERQIEEGRGTCISMLCCPSLERERDR